MNKPYRGTTGNHWKLPVIVVAAVSFAACSLPLRIGDSRTTPANSTTPASPAILAAPAVDYSRLEEMHKKYSGGRFFFEKGEFEHAIRNLEPVWQWNSDYEQVTFYLTRSLLLSGLESYADQQYRIAIDQWEKALQVDPGNAKADRYMARAWQELQLLKQVEDG
jgi:tetratricopeptide (TPR) repeat protein